MISVGLTKAVEYRFEVRGPGRYVQTVDAQKVIAWLASDGLYPARLPATGTKRSKKWRRGRSPRACAHSGGDEDMPARAIHLAWDASDHVLGHTPVLDGGTSMALGE